MSSAMADVTKAERKSDETRKRKLSKRSSDTEGDIGTALNDRPAVKAVQQAAQMLNNSRPMRDDVDPDEVAPVRRSPRFEGRQPTGPEGPKAKKPRTRRNKEAGVRPDLGLFDNSDSELSDYESDIDERFKQYPQTAASVLNPGHAPQVRDKNRQYATGLLAGGTYLLPLYKGSVIPREIKGRLNEGHRKPMGTVEKKIKASMGKRDALYGQMDQAMTDSVREQHADAAQELLAADVRPHLDSILFSSNQPRKAALDNRAHIRKQLRTDDSPVAGLAYAPKEQTNTHAEQSFIRSTTWEKLFQKLVAATREQKDPPELMHERSPATLVLALNRSTCIDCARELVTELVRFWTEVAKERSLKDWKEAKSEYEHQVRFTVTFPSIYELAQEKRGYFRRFHKIVTGLQDAGWKVKISGPLAGGDLQKNAAARMRVDQVTAAPNFVVKDWKEAEYFEMPPQLKKDVGGASHVLINNLLYQNTDGGNSLIRENTLNEDQQKATNVTDTFVKRGTSAPQQHQESAYESKEPE
ncbi:MAG TPA: hypothetical protein VGJ81_20895 [Thermoanaerobaculia bacterium]|jgi:hypothetical protein